MTSVKVMTENTTEPIDSAIQKKPLTSRPTLTIAIVNDEPEKRCQSLVMSNFEETEKAFHHLCQHPPTPRSPHFPPARSLSMSPNPNRVSVGLDHLDNLCRLMEQLAQLRDENTRLKKRCTYLEDTKSLMKARFELLNLSGEFDLASFDMEVDKGGTWPAIKHGIHSKEHLEAGRNKDEAKDARKPGAKHGRLSGLDFDTSADLPSPDKSTEETAMGISRKRSQSMDSIDVLSASIYTSDSSEFTGILDYKKHGVNRLIDKQKLVEAKARLKKFTKWDHMKKVFSPNKMESVDAIDEPPKDNRKRSKTVDLSAIVDEDPYFGVWMGPPEWVKESNMSSDESIEKQEVYLMDLSASKTSPTAVSPPTGLSAPPSEGEQLVMDMNLEQGTTSPHIDSKKTGRKAWGRVRDILHTRKDSLKRKSWGKSKDGDDLNQLARSRSDEHLTCSPPLIDGSLMVSVPADTSKSSEATQATPVPVAASPNSPRQSPSLATNRKSAPVGQANSTPPHSPHTPKAKWQSLQASPHGSPLLLRKSKVSPQLITIHSTDIIDSAENFTHIDSLHANISDDFAKKMEEWERIKGKAINRLSRSPRSPRRDFSAPSSPGANPVARASFADQLPTNIEDLQKNLSESFSRKLEDWERKKYQKQKGERSQSLDRKSEAEKEKTNTTQPKQKQKKDKPKQTRDHPLMRNKNKKRNKQESLDSSDPSVDRLSDEFAKRLREWEIKKGFVSSDNQWTTVKDSMTKSFSFDHDVTPEGIGVNPYLDVEETILSQSKKELVDETTSIDSRLDSFSILEHKNSELSLQLQGRDADVLRLQEEIERLQQNTEELERSRRPVSPDMLNLSLSVNELWKRVLELQEYGDSLAAEKKRLETEADVSQTKHCLKETELLQALQDMRANVSQELTNPPPCSHIDHMQGYVTKLNEHVKDLKLGILERNHAIETLRHRLLMQEVNHLLTQAQTARHSVELKELKHSKKRVPRRWKTFSGTELWLADQLNKSGLEKTLGDAVKRCHKLRTSCLSFDQDVEQFRHGDLDTDDLLLERSYCAPESPDAASGSPEVKSKSVEVQVQPITADADTLTMPTELTTANRRTSTTKSHLRKQKSVEDEPLSNVDVSFTVQLEQLEGGPVISQVNETSPSNTLADTSQCESSNSTNDRLNVTDEEKSKTTSSPADMLQNDVQALENAQEQSLNNPESQTVEPSLVSTHSPLVKSKHRRRSPGEMKFSNSSTSPKFELARPPTREERRRSSGSLPAEKETTRNTAKNDGVKEPMIKKKTPAPTVVELASHYEFSESFTNSRSYTPSPPALQHTIVSPVRKLKTAQELMHVSTRALPGGGLSKAKLKESVQAPVEGNHEVQLPSNEAVMSADTQLLPSVETKTHGVSSVAQETLKVLPDNSEKPPENNKLEHDTSVSKTILCHFKRSPSPQVQEIARKLSSSLAPDLSVKHPPKDLVKSGESGSSKFNKLRDQFASSRPESSDSTDSISRASPGRTVPNRKKSVYEVPKEGTVARAREIFLKHDSDTESPTTAIAGKLSVFDSRERSNSSPVRIVSAKTSPNNAEEGKYSGVPGTGAIIDSREARKEDLCSSAMSSSGLKQTVIATAKNKPLNQEPTERSKDSAVSKTNSSRATGLSQTETRKDKPTEKSTVDKLKSSDVAKPSNLTPPLAKGEKDIEKKSKTKTSRTKSLDRAKKAFNRIKGQSSTTSEDSKTIRHQKSRSTIEEDTYANLSTDEEGEKKQKSRSRFLDRSWIQKGKKFFRVSKN